MREKGEASVWGMCAVRRGACAGARFMLWLVPCVRVCVPYSCMCFSRSGFYVVKRKGKRGGAERVAASCLEDGVVHPMSTGRDV